MHQASVLTVLLDRIYRHSLNFLESACNNHQFAPVVYLDKDYHFEVLPGIDLYVQPTPNPVPTSPALVRIRITGGHRPDQDIHITTGTGSYYAQNDRLGLAYGYLFADYLDQSYSSSTYDWNWTDARYVCDRLSEKVLRFLRSIKSEWLRKCKSDAGKEIPYVKDVQRFLHALPSEPIEKAAVVLNMSSLDRKMLSELQHVSHNILQLRNASYGRRSRSSYLKAVRDMRTLIDNLSKLVAAKLVSIYLTEDRSFYHARVHLLHNQQIIEVSLEYATYRTRADILMMNDVPVHWRRYYQDFCTPLHVRYEDVSAVFERRLVPMMEFAETLMTRNPELVRSYQDSYRHWLVFGYD